MAFIALTDKITTDQSNILLTSSDILQPNQARAVGWYKTWARGAEGALTENFTLNWVTQSGTVSITSGTNTITGSGTSFLSLVGRRIRISGQDRFILSASSNTSAVISTAFEYEGNWSSSATSVSYDLSFVSTWLDSSGNGFTVTANNNTYFTIAIDSDGNLHVKSLNSLGRLTSSAYSWIGKTNFMVLTVLTVPTKASSTERCFWDVGASDLEAGLTVNGFVKLTDFSSTQMRIWGNYSDTLFNNPFFPSTKGILMGRQFGTTRRVYFNSTLYLNTTASALSFQGNRIALMGPNLSSGVAGVLPDTRFYDVSIYDYAVTDVDFSAIRLHYSLKYSI
jgi:hypothetical protein